MGVTRADVARTAGVSPALVSYVLNGGPRPVSARNRERVLQAIEELNYRPNRVAQALRANRTNSIALVMPDHVNPHFAELAQVVEDEAFAADHVLIIGTAANDAAREQEYLHAFVDRKVDGVLLISAASSPDPGWAAAANLPVVLLDRAPAGSDVSTVVIDNASAARTAVAHLLQHGVRRPALISGPPEITAVQERDAGWRAALEQHRVTASGPSIHTAFSREGGYDAMRELLGRTQRPDAVFVASDAQAIGAVRACREAGVRVGSDVALVSFDGTEAGRYSDPPLTSVDQGVHRLARTAIEVLLRRIAAPDEPAEHHVLQTELRLGGSCGCSTSSR